jgi:phage terminase small subunit
VKKLDARESIFVAQYLVDLDPQRAALVAGYSKSMAKSKAYQWVSDSKRSPKPHVFAAVQAQIKKQLSKYEITADRVLREIALSAYANMEDYVQHDNGDITPDLSRATRDQMAAVQEFTVDRTGDGERRLVLRTKLKLHNKTENLKLLGQYLKLFIDRVEVSGSLKSLSDEEIERKVRELLAKAKS